MRALAAAVLVAVVAASTVAEVLSTTGEFEGIYHRNRWGFAGLDVLRFDEAIERRLDQYEGQRIRVTVTEGEQPFTPGPVLVHQIDRIEVLPPSPVRLELSLRPPTPGPGEPFQAIVTVVNHGDDTVLFGGSSDDQVTFSLISEREAPNGVGGPTRPYPAGAEPAGRATGWGAAADRSSPIGLQFASWRQLEAHSRKRLGHGHMVLPPGASFPLVVSFREGVGWGAHELTVASARRVGDDYIPTFTALSLDVTPVVTVRPNVPLEASDVDVHRIDTWTHEVTLRVRADEDTRIATNEHGVVAFLANGSAADGTQVPVLPANELDATWSLTELCDPGRRLTLRVGHATSFPDAALARLDLALLTQAGLVPVDVPISVDDDVEPVPFGPACDGVRIRGVAKDPVQKDGGARLAFHFEAENLRGTPVMWRTRDGNRGVTITIDGEPVEVRNGPPRHAGGWARQQTCGEPVPVAVYFDRPDDLRPGRHVLRVTLHSLGGTRYLADGVEVPVIKGDIVSNDIEFVVD